MNRFFEDNRYAISWGILGVVGLALFGSIFLITKTIHEVKAIGQNDNYYYNSISMSGEGEVVAVADIASFNFSVNENAATVEAAQKLATDKINAALDYVKSQGIEDKDIKTTSYNINPRYEWKQGICNEFRCDGENVLVGYDVSQYVDIKVRDTAKAGEILSGIGGLGISNVSGLQFTIDDTETLQAEARAKAIADAKTKAEQIAEELGVKIVRVVSFNEDSYPAPYYGEGMGGMYDSAVMKNEAAPQLPSGENKVTSRVYVTFEIK